MMGVVMSSWISTNDKLPENNGLYLGVVGLTSHEIRLFEKDKLTLADDDICGVVFENGVFVYLIYGCEYEQTVNYWCLLPNLPDKKHD